MGRSRFGAALMLSFIVAIFVGSSQAAVYNVSSLSNTPGAIGFDPDKPAPLVTPNGFYAAGDDNGGVNGDYASIRFTPDAIGMTGLTLGQISAVSYTAQNDVAGTLDWRFKVYTTDQDGGGPAWYGVRVEAPTTTSGTTVTLHPLTSYDRITGGNNSFNYYAPDPQVTAQAFAAGSQPVLFFDISAGAKTGGYDYATLLNNISVTASGYGTSSIVAVPEPASLGLLALGGLGLLRRKR
jgi:PEP-CTERM motif-containing protein